jgi:uncharacterized lipoprotein YajG
MHCGESGETPPFSSHSSVVQVWRARACKLAAVAAVTLGGCGTTKGGLKYEGAGGTQVASGSGQVAVGTFVDQRGEVPTWLGVIRGGFGNPLKTLEGDRPVAELVRAGFVDGLKSRGYQISQDAPATIAGTVRALYADRYARREANVEIEIMLTRRGGAAPAFTRTYSANRVEGSAVTLRAGIFGSVEDLRSFLAKTLGEVIDEALGDPALIAALR